MIVLVCHNKHQYYDDYPYIIDNVTTSTVCPVVHLLSTFAHSSGSNKRVQPSLQLPQAVPDLCELH